MIAPTEYLDRAPAPTLADLERAFRDVAARYAGLTGPKGRADIDRRAIVATVYGGNYGAAGLVLAINGSPPRGVFLVSKEALEGGDWEPIIYVYGGATKTLRRDTSDRQAVERYARSVWRARGEYLPGWPEGGAE